MSFEQQDVRETPTESVELPESISEFPEPGSQEFNDDFFSAKESTSNTTEGLPNLTIFDSSKEFKANDPDIKEFDRAQIEALTDLLSGNRNPEGRDPGIVGLTKSDLNGLIGGAGDGSDQNGFAYKGGIIEAAANEPSKNDAQKKKSPERDDSTDPEKQLKTLTKIPKFPINPGAGAVGMIPGKSAEALKKATPGGSSEVLKETIKKGIDPLNQNEGFGGKKEKSNLHYMGSTWANDGYFQKSEIGIYASYNGGPVKLHKVPMALPGGGDKIAVQIKTDGTHIYAQHGKQLWILGPGTFGGWKWTKMKKK